MTHSTGSGQADPIDRLITRVLEREGGFVDDPADAGGPTKYGITLATLHDWRKASVSADDVRQLGEDEARRIYRARYFPAGFEAIPDAGLLELLFDFGVNSGPAAPVKALQTVLQRGGLYDGAIDGGFGPKSAAALAQVRNWPALCYAVKCERYELFMRWIGARPENARFAIGWSNRQDQFEERVA
jgi:lysozyme family protein